MASTHTYHPCPSLQVPTEALGFSVGSRGGLGYLDVPKAFFLSHTLKLAEDLGRQLLGGPTPLGPVFPVSPPGLGPGPQHEVKQDPALSTSAL